MDVVAAEGCNCATDGWFPSPILLVLIATVVLAGSVVTALVLQRRAARRPSPMDGAGPRVVKAGLVTVTLPPSPLHSDDDPETTGPAAGGNRT